MIRLVRQIGRVGEEYIVKLGERDEERAVELLKKLVIFDLHMHGVVGPEDPNQVEEWMRTFRYELGYEGIRKAGLTAFIDGFGSMAHTWKMEDTVREIGLRWCDIYRNYKGVVIKALRAEDVRSAKKENRIAMFIGIENSELIGNDLNNVDILYGLGVRAMGLCYSKRNLVGDGRTERTNAGLSNFGYEVIKRMNELGILIDGAHAGIRTTLEAIEASQAPMIISHTGAQKIYSTARMATDEELRAIAKKGGLVGIHSGPNVLSNGKRQTVEEDIMKHLDYCVELIGINHVAIGSDNYFGDKMMMHKHTIKEHPSDGLQNYLFDNAPYLEGMENPSEWPNLVRALIKRGYTDKEIEKLVGGNVMRVIEEVVG